MKFSELFHSIQGEGKLVGVPSVFFRTSFCNLRCSWCDTPYTSWEPEDKDISIGDAFNAIVAFDCSHVVITGGEPFIQAEELAALCGLLSDARRHVTIETNATVYAPVRADLISMSPKLENSNPSSTCAAHRAHDAKRINSAVIRRFLENHDCQTKFVIDSKDDMEEVARLVKVVPIPSETVVLMPQGRTADETGPKMEWLAEICRANGFRLSPRLHVDIWGDRRGV